MARVDFINLLFQKLATPNPQSPFTESGVDLKDVVGRWFAKEVYEFARTYYATQMRAGFRPAIRVAQEVSPYDDESLSEGYNLVIELGSAGARPWRAVAHHLSLFDMEVFISLGHIGKTKPLISIRGALQMPPVDGGRWTIETFDRHRIP